MTIGEHIAHNQPDTHKQIYLLWVINPLKEQIKGQLRLQKARRAYYERNKTTGEPYRLQLSRMRT